MRDKGILSASVVARHEAICVSKQVFFANNNHSLSSSIITNLTSEISNQQNDSCDAKDDCISTKELQIRISFYIKKNGIFTTKNKGKNKPLQHMRIAELLLLELRQESANTRKMIERVPTDKLEWRPHEKSMSIGRLATHIAEIPIWFGRIISASEFDFAASVFKPEKRETTEEIVDVFDKQMAEAINILQNASDETMNAVFTMRRGEQVLLQLPRKVVLRTFAFNHVYHHRGQLSVYLRLLNIPVPGMYGPSADEKR